MKLVEVQPFKYDIVEKSKHDGVLMTLEGVFQRADTRNANKRVYPKALWQKVLSNEDVKTRLDSRRMLGELDHPAKGATSLDRVSHVITDQTLLPSGEVRGSMDILDTPKGRIAETLFRAGVQLGISSRGDGSVEQKGDESEVQDDYRLETYDLVLKPSTPGAYPAVVESEEQAEQNLSLIANAVEGLVNSTDASTEVLLECHKIISVLEGCDERRDTIQKKLVEKLKLGPQEKPNSENQSEEEDMSKNNPQQGIGDLSPELAALIREHAEAMVADRLGEKDKEINCLNKMIVDLTQEKEEVEGRLGAAESLIEEFKRKVEELSENQSTDEDLAARYKAALRLIDEATNRLQEFGETKRRLEAAKQLLSKSIDLHKESAVESAVENVLSGLSEETADKLRPILESCATPDEVNSRFSELSSLIESVRTVEREPLPGGSVNENQPDGGNGVSESKHPDMITSRLLDRFTV